MDLSVEDTLFEWALNNHPALLQDLELFGGLIRFSHAVLSVALEERATTMRRILKASTS